eukprot:TRINITY_DN5737_c1_g3_i1.p2 TRINITY_DN5737_c1_g3~~TRINITY_DN5737_c1_g3_i1.p2  ORF type:complete len:122 (+),score=1.22 TRINITY_DN5737_c1_g3_i1:74-439(+)
MVFMQRTISLRNPHQSMFNKDDALMRNMQRNINEIQLTKFYKLSINSNIQFLSKSYRDVIEQKWYERKEIKEVATLIFVKMQKQLFESQLETLETKVQIINVAIRSKSSDENFALTYGDIS